MIRIPREGDLMRLTQECGTTELDGETEITLPVGTLLRVDGAVLLRGNQGFQIMVTPLNLVQEPIGEGTLP